MASALIQGSHAAYYIFASIAWQQAGYDGLTIAVLWVLGVIAEIVLFALSPRFTLQPSMLVVIAALSAAARWVITAQDPPLAILAIVQLAHALSFGLTQVGIMGLMLHHVPGHVMARAQGYLTACGGIVAGLASIASGTSAPTPKPRRSATRKRSSTRLRPKIRPARPTSRAWRRSSLQTARLDAPTRGSRPRHPRVVRAARARDRLRGLRRRNDRK